MCYKKGAYMFTKTCKYITMLFAILTICAGCDEHSNKDNDPGTQNPIPTCVGDDCTNNEVVCQTAGAVNCNGVCIDPMTSDKYCGANAFCENYVACSGNESCQAGRCRETVVDPSYSCIAEGIVKCDGKDVTLNFFCVSPYSVKAVKISLFTVENVNDDVTEVKKNPHTACVTF